MNILLTGANGFLGSYIYNELSVVYNVDKLSRSNSNYNLDLSSSIPSLNKDYDLIIHAAGRAHVNPISNIESRLFFDVNVNGTYNLLKALSLRKLPKFFVFISSVSVYGLSEGQLIDENTSLDANDPYGISKIEAEKLIINWCNHNNVIYTIFRLPLVVGANAPGNLGAMINAIKKGYYFNIGGGNSRKSMVLASDISKCIIKASQIGGIYNLTDKFHPSFYELSQVIVEQIGKKNVLNIPMFIAKIFALIGDLFGSKFPINSAKLNKINSTLTFDDAKAQKTFNWNPSPIISEFKLL